VSGWVFKHCAPVRALSGDVIQLEVDTGFNQMYRPRIRLIGVDVPGKNMHPEGWQRAMEFSSQWLYLSGDLLTLECMGEDKSGGRWFGHIRNRMNESLALALIHARLGIPLALMPSHEPISDAP
jgi:hypothetical protein